MEDYDNDDSDEYNDGPGIIDNKLTKEPFS